MRLVEGYGLPRRRQLATSVPVRRYKQSPLDRPADAGTTVEIVAIDGSERMLPVGNHGEDVRHRK